ncbi:MAG: 4,5-DOPA dioxygenase extradiol [Bacteroidetes bacterium]|nr:4,5-DOPA dioxygenase extradiol [Bacteroidota bacterium]
MALIPAAGSILDVKVFGSIALGFSNTARMPVLFLGHGSPMNAIEENEFVRGFRTVASEIASPQAILCISAHWETKGTFVTAMDHPRTIQDFGGFPQALFDVQYPAPGSALLAQTTKEMVTATEVGMDHQWGLDHGAWSVIKQMYPKANVPVVQLSLDYTKPPQYHYDLAVQLAALRSKGILIIGSGNMIHNLGLVAWDKLNEKEFGYDWALEAQASMKKFIHQKNHQSLINYNKHGRAFELSIPTPEHYLPLLYILALQDKDEQPQLFNDKAIGGSLTMTSVRIDKV